MREGANVDIIPEDLFHFSTAFDVVIFNQSLEHVVFFTHNQGDGACLAGGYLV